MPERSPLPRRRRRRSCVVPPPPSPPPRPGLGLRGSAYTRARERKKKKDKKKKKEKKKRLRRAVDQTSGLGFPARALPRLLLPCSLALKSAAARPGGTYTRPPSIRPGPRPLAAALASALGGRGRRLSAPLRGAQCSALRWDIGRAVAAGLGAARGTGRAPRADLHGQLHV